MDFQPFGMPDPGTAGVNAGLDSLDNALVRAAQADRERKRLMAENLRNAYLTKREREEDVQRAYERAQERLKAGDIEGAKLALSPFMEGGWTPVQPAQPAQSAPRAPADQVPGLTAPPMDTPGFSPGSSTSDEDDLTSHHAGIAPQTPSAMGPPSPPVHPLVALAQADKKRRDAENAQAVRTLTGRFNGQEITLDPDAYQRRRDEERGQFVQQMEQSGIDQKHLRFASTLLSMGVDPAKVGNLVGGMIEKDAALQTSSQNVDKRIEGAVGLEKVKQGGRIDLENLQQTGGKYRRRGGSGGGGGGNLKEARPVLAEMDNALKPITQKGGLRERLEHSESSLNQLRKDPNNPVAWVNAIDAAIRTNTGRAAIKAQFDLYMGHAHGTSDQFSAWLQQFRNGLPSKEQRDNLMASFEAANGELRRESKEAFDNFRRYDEDPRVQRNRAIAEGYQARERNTFGTMPGYQHPAGAAPATLSPADKAFAEQARQRLAKNPNDTVAKKWLEAHGL